MYLIPPLISNLSFYSSHCYYIITMSSLIFIPYLLFYTYFLYSYLSHLLILIILYLSYLLILIILYLSYLFIHSSYIFRTYLYIHLISFILMDVILLQLSSIMSRFYTYRCNYLVSCQDSIVKDGIVIYIHNVSTILIKVIILYFLYLWIDSCRMLYSYRYKYVVIIS